MCSGIQANFKIANDFPRNLSLLFASVNTNIRITQENVIVYGVHVIGRWLTYHTTLT